MQKTCISLQSMCPFVPCVNSNIMQEYHFEVRKVERLIDIIYKHTANRVIYCATGYFVNEMA